MLKDGKFDQEFMVPSYMLDSYVQLTPVCLMAELQEVAASHCSVFKLSGIDLKPLNLFWVLSRMHVQIERIPLWHEKLTVRTWEKPHSYISQPRDFQVLDEQGNVIVRAASIWAIIDAKSKPQKLEDFDMDIRTPIDEDALTTKAFPRMPAAPKLENPTFKTVLHSDIDLNEHVNNTKYLQWVLDEWGHDFCMQHPIEEISIHFISQLWPGNQYYISQQQINEHEWKHTIYAQDDHREVCQMWMKVR